MQIFDYLCLTAAAVAVAAAVVVWLVCRRRRKKLLQSLNKMLDMAIAGDFKENTFDESLLSATESKMADYLASSLVTAANLSAERDKIKSLIADISHQTKTPIANILLYSQLLAECVDEQKADGYIGELQVQAEKLSFLINSLVKISRLETGILAVVPERNDVGEMLEGVTAQVRPKAAAKNIEIKAGLCGLFCYFDPKWTAEAVYNILDNAVKYTPPGGRITVSCRSYELFGRIDISDNGIGIAEEEQSKIFTRFYRSPSVRQSEGVGIGLYLARTIISEQGGYIKVQSEVGGGAVFSVFLPRETASR